MDGSGTNGTPSFSRRRYTSLMVADPTPPAPEVADLACFALLDAEQWRLLSSTAQQEELAAGYEVYTEGATGTDFLVVASGRLEARRQTPMGVQRVASLGQGELVGEISLLDHRPRSSSVVVVEGCRVWRFDGAEVATLTGRHPGLRAALLRAFCRSLAGKIRQANVVMTEIMAPGARQERPGRGSSGEVRTMEDVVKRRLLHEGGLSSDELQQLSRHLEASHYPSGARIFAEGEAGDTLYLVADGRVRISRRIPGMGEEALAILGRGEVFGELAWIDSSSRSADAIAHVGGATVLGIPRAQLDGTIGSNIEAGCQFLEVICRILCRRVRTMNDLLVAYRTMAWFE